MDRRLSVGSVVAQLLDLDGVMEVTAEIGRTEAVYSAAHMDDARAVFMFRTHEPLDYHYRDASRQKHLLREHFANLD